MTVGTEPVSRTRSSLSTGVLGVVVELTDSVPSSGYLVSWDVYIAHLGYGTGLQVWRPSDTEATYRLIGGKVVDPPRLGLHTIELSGLKRIPVETGDVLGFSCNAGVRTVSLTANPDVHNYNCDEDKVLLITEQKPYSQLPNPGDEFMFQSAGPCKLYSYNAELHVSGKFTNLNKFKGKTFPAHT